MRNHETLITVAIATALIITFYIILIVSYEHGHLL